METIEVINDWSVTPEMTDFYSVGGVYLHGKAEELSHYDCIHVKGTPLKEVFLYGQITGVEGNLKKENPMLIMDCVLPIGKTKVKVIINGEKRDANMYVWESSNSIWRRQQIPEYTRISYEGYVVLSDDIPANEFAMRQFKNQK